MGYMATALDKFARLAALKPARETPRRDTTLRDTNDTDLVGRMLGAGVARNEFGEHLAIRNWYSTPEFAPPSEVALEILSRVSGSSHKKLRANSPLFPDVRQENANLRMRAALENPEKWLFLDTETTGLSGGTGTYAFLVGLAWWDGGGLQVEQLFLRDFSEEHSMLQELSARLAERPVLVTFNGKTFDWPLLENRFTMTRKIPVPKLTAHLDLLHPARALWKLRLGSARLVELEREVLDAPRLGWHRIDDIASSFIPQYYFEYLRGGTPDRLVGVAKHNQMDLRGLAALYGKINSLLDEREANLTEIDSRDLFGLSRFLNRKGEKDRAHSVCSRALDAGLPPEFRPQATRELALLAKNRGDWQTAVRLWREIVNDPQDGTAACEQLAIFHERRARDWASALEYVELGLARSQRQLALTLDPSRSARAARWEAKFMCRLKRLRHRINREAAAVPTSLLGHSGARNNARLRSR
jgi:uncharacterized protein YprB with RNaseH-like and TPR domain